MRGKTLFSIIGLAAGGTLAVFLLLVSGGTAGEWHSGANNVCWDCHTMHFSMQHQWDSLNPITQGSPASGGNWLGNQGPNNFLLKLPANLLCLACHDGQTFAPDVLGTNSNASPAQGRSAGALNDPGLGAPYDEWKGHTLGSTATPPGFDPARVGLSQTWYNSAGGLECINCHAQHGPTTSYRNLGPFSMTGTSGSGNFRPTYKFSTTAFDFASLCRNETTASGTCDVRINLGAPPTMNSGNAATFNQYYDFANISYGRNDGLPALGTTTSNRLDSFCGACHGTFHGGPPDTNISNAQTIGGLDGFIRHPTSGITLGAAGLAGYGGHSSLTRYVANVTKVPVYSGQPAWADASPGCASCHKAHGNQNPFGLFFLNRNATSVGEEGGYGTGQPGTLPPLQVQYRNLCGQCHSQGN